MRGATPVLFLAITDNARLDGIRTVMSPAPAMTEVDLRLERGGELWKQLERSGGLAMHIAGDFPGLEIEFWAIRG